MINLAILISGRGSNMMAIHQAIQSGKLDAKIQLVLSNTAKAAGLEYTQREGIPTAILEKEANESRASYDDRLTREIEKHPIDYICLAGFMRILSKGFVDYFHHRILNIHPSLLPAFPGLDAQKQALEAEVTTSGCTVHFVDEGCDTGPIIDQRVVPVLPEDDEVSLSERILREEHQLYSFCLQKLAEGKVNIEGNKVILK